MNKLSWITLALTIGIVGSISSCGGGDEQSGPPPSRITQLDLSMGLLKPKFDPSILNYTSTLSFAASTIRIKLDYFGEGILTIDGVQVGNGVATLPLSMAEGENVIEVVFQSGSETTTYTLNLFRQSLEQFTQSAYIKASNTGEDSFGYSVALDGNTMIVGAYEEDSNATGIDGNQLNDSMKDSGAAYIFVHENGSWTQEAYLKASNSGSDDNFGRSVAIDGDTVVIGAYGEDSNASGVDGDELDNTLEDSGAAYVFIRSNGAWQQQAYIKASNPDEADEFGGDVSISGDTIAIGAALESSDARGVNGDQSNNDSERSGAVYIFQRNSGQWSQQSYIKSSNNDPDDIFGIALDLDENYLVVSAITEESAATGVNGDQSSNDKFRSGAVYTFERAGSSWNQKDYIKASNPDEHDGFGVGISLDGDTLAISASLEGSDSVGINGDQNNNDGFQSGAVYVFVRAGGSWIQQAYIKASNSFKLATFGSRTLALKGDRLIVSSRRDKSRSSGVNGDQSGNDVFDISDVNNTYFDGAAYLFERENGAWAQIAYLKASNTHEYMAFGKGLALSDDFVVVGAAQEKSPSVGVNPNQDVFNEFDRAGAVYVFPNR